MYNLNLHKPIGAFLCAIGAICVLSGCQSAIATEPRQTEQVADDQSNGGDAQGASETESDPAIEALFSSSSLQYSEPDPLLGFVDGRTTVSLNGDWNTIIDPMFIGDPQLFAGGFPRNAKPKTPMDLIEYSFETGPKLRVPGDWNSQDERLFFYQGTVWYHKTFDAAQLPAGRTHLFFGGVNFLAQVHLNGEPIGQNQGGYVPFSFDITDKIKPGVNDIVVRVDNTLSGQTVPTARTDWWPYGGLTRDVMLVSTPSEYIRNAKISLDDHDSGTVTAVVETEGFETGTTVSVDIPELGSSQRLTVDDSGVATGQFAITAELWSPDSPKLYDVVFSAAGDSITDSIGFRTIQTRGSEILLNGQPIRLRGISSHEEPIAEPGAAYSIEHAKRKLAEVKALNANFLRAAHYPYSRHIARAADEEGILLWAEVPVYWMIDWENDDTLKYARNQMGRLVQRDWNRASVIIWSVANETPAIEPRMQFLGTLIDDVRTLDGTRLVSAALLGGVQKQFDELVARLAVRGLSSDELSPGAREIFTEFLDAYEGERPGVNDGLEVLIEDPLSELIDVIAYNQYFGWYYSTQISRRLGVGEDELRPLMLSLMPDLSIGSKTDKPIHISEFGAGAKFGRRGGDSVIWTEEYQRDVYQAQVQMLSNSPQVQGMSPWILKDFRTMLRTLPGVQDNYNRKGLIDENGNRKLAFYVMRDFYGSDWGQSEATDAD